MTAVEVTSAFSEIMLTIDIGFGNCFDLYSVCRPTEGCWGRDCKSHAKPSGGRRADQCFEGEDGSSVRLLQRQRERVDAVCWLTLLADSSVFLFGFSLHSVLFHDVTDLGFSSTAMINPLKGRGVNLSHFAIQV